MTSASRVSYGAALGKARAALQAAGVESAALDARLLMADAAGLHSAALIARAGEILPALAEIRLDAHIQSRICGTPVARILGEKEFWGLSFAIDAATLVPRPDTETLVEAVLAEAPSFRPAPTICDLGAGSGAIVVALLTELPEAKGIAADISEPALAIARLNAERHGVLTRIGFHCGDFAAGPDGPFDVVVSNPPYVKSRAIADLPREVKDHDPRLALDGGVDGMDAYRTILARAGALLAQGGMLAFEVGFDQGGAVAAMCEDAGLGSVKVRPDLAGHGRVVTAWRGASRGC